MFKVPVFKAEIDLGLADVIRSTARVAYASRLKPAKQVFSEKLIASLKSYLGSAKASIDDADLFYLESILASTVWNLNDDVFDPIETWQARHTPVDKPINNEHDCSKIIGHITSGRVIDTDGNEIADDTALDELPEKFHLVSGGVLYRKYDKEDLQTQADLTIAAIDNGERFVSMECLFKGFDYAVMEPDGAISIVARSSKTAFLTKHLKAYGGTGEFNGRRIGRLLRNILFSGKGVVAEPANPESIIFENAKAFITSKAEVVTDFDAFSKAKVYSPHDTGYQPTSQIKESSEMAQEVNPLQAQFDALKVENESLKAAARENDVKAVSEAKAKLETELAEASKKIAELTTNLEQVTKAKVDLETKSTESETALAEVRDELKQIRVEQKKQDRITKVKAALQVDGKDEAASANALELADTMLELSDDKFEAQLKIVAKFTPVPKVAPKATEIPSPVSVKASVEHDAAEANADTAVLETAKVEKTEAAVSSVPAPDGVKNLQDGINKFFRVSK